MFKLSFWLELREVACVLHVPYLMYSFIHSPQEHNVEKEECIQQNIHKNGRCYNSPLNRCQPQDLPSAEVAWNQAGI